MGFQYPKPFTPLPRSTFGRLPEQEGEGLAAKRRGGGASVLFSLSLYLRISQSLSPSVRKLPILVCIHMLAESEQHLLVITDWVLRGT